MLACCRYVLFSNRKPVREKKPGCSWRSLLGWETALSWITLSTAATSREMSHHWHLRPRACFARIDTSRYSNLWSVHSAIRELRWFMMSLLKKEVLVILSFISTHRTAQEWWLQYPPFYSQRISSRGKRKRDQMAHFSCSCGCRDPPLAKRKQSAEEGAFTCIKQKGKEEGCMLILYWGRSCPDALADRSHLKCWHV